MLHINIQTQLGDFSLKANLEIHQGVTALFGLSGSGKSSLINAISGLVPVQQGRIVLNQRILVDTNAAINVPVHQRKIGYVFQDARLFPHYSIKRNLCYGMEKFDQAQFDQIVQLLGIEHLLKRYPMTLSGGEKQRVAIGRALLSQPDILLMDEPLSALDLPRKRELMDYLENLARHIQIPIIYVTHSLDELLRLADRVVLLENGKVTAYDSVENLWENPLFLAWKLEEEQSAVLSLPISQHKTDYKMTALALGQQLIWIKQPAQHKDLVRICIKSTDVAISLQMPQQTSVRNILTGHIQQIVEQDNRIDIQVAVEGKGIWASVSQWAYDELNLQLNQPVFVQIKAVSLL